MQTSNILSSFSQQPGGRAANRSWLVVLALVAVAGSSLPCLMPFSALAVALVATLRLRTSLLAMTGFWLINQAIGFGVFRFPHTAETIGWGFIMGAAALGATLVASALMQRAPFRAKFARVAVAFIAAFVAWELVLLAAVPFLGGLATFAPAILGRIARDNAIWLVALVGMNELVARLVRPWLGASTLIMRSS